MTRLLLTASRRHLARHPLQAALAVLGVALGVAVVIAVDLANASAERAFRLSSEAVSGRATHRLVGGPGGLDEALFRRLVVELGIRRAAPVVEEYVEVEVPGAATPRVLRLLGVDPFSEAPFRRYVVPGGGGGPGRPGLDLGRFVTRPGAVLLAAGTAAELGLEPGDTLQLRVGDRRREAELAGVLEPADELGREALSDLLLADVASAQELLGQTGRLTRIDLVLAAGDAGERELERLRRALPADAAVVPAAARAQSTQGMSRAFSLNLRALSLLAMVCGLFLIYNTMTFSVVQRRTLLGTLRAVGVTRRQVFALVLGEAALVGAVGTAVGLLLGAAMGRGLVGLVTRTLNDLYFVVSVRDLALPAELLGRVAAGGLAATVLAALPAAVEATWAPPRAALSRAHLERRRRQAVPRAAVAAVVLLAAGGALLAWPGGGLLAAFAGLFGVLVGCALLTPAATVLSMRLLRPLAGAAFGLLGRMAARGVVAALSRTGVAVAALTVAVSVTVGVGTMIASFRGTVADWLRSSLEADVYVTAPTRGGGFTMPGLDPELVERLRAVPGAARVNTVRRVEIASDDRVDRLVAFDLDTAGRAGFELLSGDPAAAWPAVDAGRAVLVSEPYAYRRRLAVGDPVALRTDRGEVSLPVAGVVTSYASDAGFVMMSRQGYDRWFDDPGVSALSLRTAPGVTPAELIARLRAAAGDRVVTIQSGGALLEASLAVFDRTFVITGVLRLLAGLVAFVGVLSALMALELERARELGVLRANGMTPRQVWGLVTAQTGLLGLAAGLFAVPVGLALAAVMIHVVNRRSFGWTMEMSIEPAILAQAVALALGAALLAGLYPARRMASTPPAAALREE